MILDRQQVATLHQQLQQALDGFAAAHGLQATVGAASFTLNNVIFKIEFAVVAPDGTAMTREAEDFVQHAACWGLSPGDLGQTISHAGQRLRIVGMHPRSKRAPIIVADDAGRRFKFPVALVQALLRSDRSQPGDAARGVGEALDSGHVSGNLSR